MKSISYFSLLLIKIVSWAIFIGLCIETGGILFNFVFSIYQPEFVKNLYQKLDLSAVFQYYKTLYLLVYFIILLVCVLKTILFYFVIQLIININLKKPFQILVYQNIFKISYFTFVSGLISSIAKQTTHTSPIFNTTIQQLEIFWVDSKTSIIMSAIIYIIATIFKKGIDLQTENDLTI